MNESNAQPRVFIIVLNWNGKDDTVDCVNSLKKLAYESYEIVLVDNNSEDDSVEVFQDLFPDIPLLVNERNMGYAGGNNVGIRYALDGWADFVLLLNNDTIADKDMVTALVDTAKDDHTIGIIGPKIYYHDEPHRLWFAGGVVDLKEGQTDHIGFEEWDQGQFDEAGESQYITGCAMMVRREVFEELGLLSEDYFGYFEDADFSMRAHKAGYRVVYEPRARLWHKESVSFGSRRSPYSTYLFTRNRLLFLKRNKASSMGFNIYSSILKHDLKKTAWPFLKRGDLPGAMAVFKGIYHYFTNHFGQR